MVISTFYNDLVFNSSLYNYNGISQFRPSPRPRGTSNIHTYIYEIYNALIVEDGSNQRRELLLAGGV